MNADDLTPEQYRALCAKLRPMQGYLRRVKARMTKRRFPNDDPVLALVLDAEDALHRLTVELHYRSCPGQTGNVRPGTPPTN